MIGFLNLVMPVIMVVGLFISYKLKTTKARLLGVVLTLATVVLYNQLQPSYVPKGTAKPAAPPAEFVIPEGEMTDRLAKPVSAEQRDKTRQAVYDEAEARRQQLMDEIKEGT